MNRYFAVETKCGHVGKEKCIFIWFAVKAESKKAATAKARGYKRVKRHHKDVIRKVREISFEEYEKLRLANSCDPYLQCKNIQQQRKIDDLEERIEADEYLISKRDREHSNRNTEYSLKRNAIRVRDALCQIRETYYDNVAV